MITLALGHEKTLVQWDPKVHYLAEEVYDRMQRRAGPIWLHVDGNSYKLHSPDMCMLACQIVVDYHNTFFYDHVADDGWNEETRQMEEKAQRFMEESSDSEDSGEYNVLNEEDY